jgi:spoIIIJ-associated protein
MKTIDVEEKTVDEAINKALEQLQVSRDQVSVEILEEGSRGFLGLVGNKPAKVRVSLGQDVSGIPEPATSERPQTPAPQKKETPIPSPHDEENVSQIVAKAKEALSVVLERLQIEYTVDVDVREEQILFNIHCDNENFLIGRRGTTLDAVQYLVNRIANKNAKEKIQVVLDTSDYRVHRKQRLQKLALRLSRKVKMTGKPVTVSPMNPHDRRIIHLTLQDDPGVKTLSKGSGFMRRITISANKNSNRNRKR